MTDLPFGSAVRLLRESRGQSAERLAADIGVSASQLARIEEGRTSLKPAREERLVEAMGFYHRRDLMLAARMARQREEKTTA